MEAIRGFGSPPPRIAFRPTSASWLNTVERFAETTRNRIRRGVFQSVPELKAAIMDYLENHNANPKPFVIADLEDLVGGQA